MPYIHFKTSLALTPEQETELKASFGRAIATLPGKSEAYLMVNLEGGAHLWLGGDNSQPLAMIDVKIYGKAKAADFSKLTGALCDICAATLGIKPSGVYVTYAEVENWGWNGKNF